MTAPISTELESIPIAPTKTLCRTQAWPAPSNILESDWFGWLNHLAHRLYAQYDLAPLGCVAVPLTIIGGLAGSGYWLQNSEGLSVTAPLNVLFTGATGSMFRQVADDLYQVPRGRLGGSSFRPSDRKAVNSKYRALQNQIAAVNAEIRKAKAETPPANQADAETPFKIAALVKQRDALVAGLQELISQYGSVLLTEGGRLENLLAPSDLSFDGAVHHVSTSGSAVSRIMGSPASLLADLADLSSNVFTSQFFTAASPCSHRELLSHTIFASEEQTRQLLRNKTLERSGLLNSFLITDLRMPRPFKFDIQFEGTKAWHGYTNIVDRLVASRFAVQKKLFTLSREPAVAMDDYIYERHHAAVELGSSCPAILDRLGPVVQKFALAIHLARGLFDVAEVDSATVKAACILMDAIVAGHLDTVSELGGSRAELPAQEGFEPQIEIIVTKLRIRGRLTQRELARTFHRQKADQWMPALSRAIELGRVTRDENGCLMLAGQDASRSTSGEPSVES